jgi:hypothetical protein
VVVLVLVETDISKRVVAVGAVLQDIDTVAVVALEYDEQYQRVVDRV